MHFTSEHTLDDGVIECRFTLGDIPGIVWMPPTTPAPLLLLGHPGGLDAMYPRLVARARQAAADGLASATIELPGGGGREPISELDAARAELRRAITAGDEVDAIVDRLVLPLVELAVPEWRAALDALLELRDIRGPVGYSGGVMAVGIRIAAVEPRIVAAGLYAGSFVPRAMFDEARRVTVPVHMLLQWDDEGNDRQLSLEVFDTLGSREKTLQANMGGHTGVPAFAGDDAARFFVRHLRPDAPERE